jgi:hypothetical protein
MPAVARRFTHVGIAVVVETIIVHGKIVHRAIGEHHLEGSRVHHTAECGRHACPPRSARREGKISATPNGPPPGTQQREGREGTRHSWE